MRPLQGSGVVKTFLWHWVLMEWQGIWLFMLYDKDQGLAQDRYRRRALVNAVMNLRVP
jgi:hypothetical protein